MPPGVVNIVTGDGSTGAHLVRAEGIDKVAFTGSTEVGKAIRRELSGRDIPLTLELGGKAAVSSSRTARSTRRSRGSSTGSTSTRSRLLCRVAAARASRSTTGWFASSSADGDASCRRSARQEHRRRCDQLEGAADRIAELVENGTAEGRRCTSLCRLPEKGWWFAPTVFTGVAQSHRIAREEIFGPVLSVSFGRRTRRSRRRTTRCTGSRRGSDGEGLADPVDGRSDACRRRLGQHVQPLRPGLAVQGYRSQGSAAKAADTSSRRT